MASSATTARTTLGGGESARPHASKKAGGLWFAGFLLWSSLAPASVHAQFQSRVETVLVRVSVSSPNGDAVRGLGKEDFRIAVDGDPREITYFESPGAPMAVMLVFDASSSMEGESSRFSVEAAKQFVDTLSAGDQVGLVAFDQRARLKLQLDSDISRMNLALESIRSRGGTALYDAVERGYRALQSNSLQRQILLVLSDGLEQDSGVSYARLERLAASRNVVFSSISWLSSDSREFYGRKGKYFKQPKLEENLNPVWVLEHLAEITGGESLFPRDRDELLEQLGEIANHLRCSYLIGFEPDSGGGRKEIFREIRVSVIHEPEYKIEHRSGYLSTSPDSERKP